MKGMLRPPVEVLPDSALVREDEGGAGGDAKRAATHSRRGKASKRPSRKRGRRKTSSRSRIRSR